MTVLSLLWLTDCYCFTLILLWKHLQSVIYSPKVFVFKEIDEKISDKYSGIQISGNFYDHAIGLVKNFQNSNGKTDGFIKLLTQHGAERKLITWDQMNRWGWLYFLWLFVWIITGSLMFCFPDLRNPFLSLFSEAVYMAYSKLVDYTFINKNETFIFLPT